MGCWTKLPRFDAKTKRSISNAIDQLVAAILENIKFFSAILLSVVGTRCSAGSLLLNEELFFMTRKHIALVGYPAEYFIHFARSLEDVGFDVYWINALTADARFLSKQGIPERNVLNVNHNFDPLKFSTHECRDQLSKLESVDSPTINDIILMDRILSKKPTDFSIRYLAHLQKVIESFLENNRIVLVTSWRDTAMQILSMLISRRQGIPFVIPTRVRIPQEMYGFCRGHDTESLIRLRPLVEEDRVWATSFLDEFENNGIRPALKKSARGFDDVIRMLPLHAKVFAYELRRSVCDAGNDYARYPIGRLVSMYVRRRINLLLYKLYPPYDSVGEGPFCLYALHTQPESSIDVVGSYFSDQINLIRFIARSLPATHELYVKVHPTDVDGKKLAFYNEINSIPSVRLIDHRIDSRSLLERSALLFALTGTIAYEAALLGKPVIVFARNFFNGLPTVTYCDSPPQLPALITKLLDTKISNDVRNKTLEFLANLRASCYNGEVSRTYGAFSAPLSPSDLRTLQEAYLAIFLK